MTEFAINLKALMKELSNRSLAKEIGISNVTVNQWFSKDCYPSYTILVKLAEYFDVTMDYFAGRSNI